MFFDFNKGGYKLSLYFILLLSQTLEVYYSESFSILCITLHIGDDITVVMVECMRKYYINLATIRLIYE